jgi:hypothetical protein
LPHHKTTHTSVCSQITFALHTHSLLQRIYTLCFVFVLSLGLYTKTAEGSISDIDGCTFVHYKLVSIKQICVVLSPNNTTH